MKTYLWIQLLFSAITIIARMAFLSWEDYPRTTKFSRGEDVFLLVAGIAFALWTVWLLLGEVK